MQEVWACPCSVGSKMLQKARILIIRSIGVVSGLWLILVFIIIMILHPQLLELPVCGGASVVSAPTVPLTAVPLASIAYDVGWVGGEWY